VNSQKEEIGLSTSQTSDGIRIFSKLKNNHDQGSRAHKKESPKSKFLQSENKVNKAHSNNSSDL